MNKFQNEGKADRIIRAILGVALLLLAVFIVTGILKIIFLILAGISLLTSIIGFCGLYKILGINTRSQ